MILSFSAILLAASLVTPDTNEFRLDEGTGPYVFLDSHRHDLRPGLRISSRVKFDVSANEKGSMTIVQKGEYSKSGCYALRVDPKIEGSRISFFVNTGDGIEPRVSSAEPVEAGRWYDVDAGWDGTNAWLTVDGKTFRKNKTGSINPIPCAGGLKVGLGFIRGAISRFSIRGPECISPLNLSISAGMRISCNVKFLSEPRMGSWTIAHKKREYWLRYTTNGGKKGRFEFFVYLDGGWEPCVSSPCRLELGRSYAIEAGWDGEFSTISVDGGRVYRAMRGGRANRDSGKLAVGSDGVIEVNDLCLRGGDSEAVKIGEFRTREFMPRIGKPVHLVGVLRNLGMSLSGFELVATGDGDVKVTPSRIPLGTIAEASSVPLEWKVDAGTAGSAALVFSLVRGKKKVATVSKTVVFMPEKEPDMSAGAWNPPIKPGRTYYIDSAMGRDSADGLSDSTAWRTFGNLAKIILGPGERVLLKRGCVFNEELHVMVRGSAENWAEIGAYGEGMRPQIRRNRDINERCAFLLDPEYVVVRDLVFCNAGVGFSAVRRNEGRGHILVERCLSHHIEGLYRFDSHGIPEWMGAKGPTAPGAIRSYGIHIGRAKNAVLRDCEMYQCSSGFAVSGKDTFVSRVFCHDNYAHNTSPHPFNTASRSWMTDCVFDASGWHASAGTMGIMLSSNNGLVIRGCHFLNQPDSGSPDQGGIDFENDGENCLIEECTFRNNAGAAIEVLGLVSPQTRNVHIRRCRFDRNNTSRKNGPSEIQVWGESDAPRSVACSNGLIEDNGYVLVPGVDFYVNRSPSSNDWSLAGNRSFDFPEELNRAYPFEDPPEVSVCPEVWIDSFEAALFANVDDPRVKLSWEQTEGPANVKFIDSHSLNTKAQFPVIGDYRVQLKADNGKLWRTDRTAVHVIPKGDRTFKVWDFSKNLDSQGWKSENTGVEYRFIPNEKSIWSSKSYPVYMACGDYLVVTMNNSSQAGISTPDEVSLGVTCSDSRVNAVRIKMQNHTNSGRMRIWWQLNESAPAWSKRNSVAFDVYAMDSDDRVYEIKMPPCGQIKQLRLSFSADGECVTGTCRIDYIWLGRMFCEVDDSSLDVSAKLKD